MDDESANLFPVSAGCSDFTAKLDVGDIKAHVCIQYCTTDLCNTWNPTYSCATKRCALATIFGYLTISVLGCMRV